MKAIIITGLSGAGKTQAMDCLEDMGYYCIDNMPPALIKSFIDLTASGKGIDKAAFVIDVRGGKLFEDLKDSLEELRRDGIEFKILYLEASDRTLIRRYNESRRSHPLSEGGTVSAGLKKEREMLELLRNNADYIIDMGPEGGKGGGELLSCGTPEEVAKSSKGYTPRFLREELGL